MRVEEIVYHIHFRCHAQSIWSEKGGRALLELVPIYKYYGTTRKCETVSEKFEKKAEAIITRLWVKTETILSISLDSKRMGFHSFVSFKPGSTTGETKQHHRRY